MCQNPVVVSVDHSDLNHGHCPSVVEDVFLDFVKGGLLAHLVGGSKVIPCLLCNFVPAADVSAGLVVAVVDQHARVLLPSPGLYDERPIWSL